LKRRTFFFFFAAKDVPARGQNHEVPQAGQGKPPFVDQAVDLIDLGHVEGGIETVVGVLLPQGFDKPFFFILPYALLGKVHHTGDLVYQEKVSSLPCSAALVLSPGHKQLYKKNSLDKFYIERAFIQEKFSVN
jgi:hypothetical protein